MEGNNNQDQDFDFGDALRLIFDEGYRINNDASDMEKGITEALQKALQVDGSRLEHFKRLQTFQDQDRHIYITCLAKILSCGHLGYGICELAGRLLMTELQSPDDADDFVEPHWMISIKNTLLGIICSARDGVPRSTFQVISELARKDNWPQLTELLECSLHDEAILTPAVLERFGYIGEMAAGTDTMRRIFKILVRGMSLKSNHSVCLAATKEMCYALSNSEINILEDIEAIINAVLEAFGSTDRNIKNAASECLIVLSCKFYSNLNLYPTYLMKIVKITATAVREGKQDDAFLAVEVLSSICEAEIDVLKKIESGGICQCYYLIRDNLKDLIPLLLPLLHMGDVELLDEKASEFDRSLCLCVGYMAQAVGKYVESFTEPVNLYIDADRTTGYNYLDKIIASTVDVFASDIFAEKEEASKWMALTEGGEKGNEMEREEGSQKPEKPNKKKGLGQWEGLLLKRILRIAGGLLKQDCEFLHNIIEDTSTRYSPSHSFSNPSAKMRDACGHYNSLYVFSKLRETHGDDLLRKFVESWDSSVLSMVQFLALLFSSCGRDSGEMAENFEEKQLQIYGLSRILLLIFPEISNAIADLIDLATKEDTPIDRNLLESVKQIYLTHGVREHNKNEASPRCAESVVLFCEKLLARGGSNDERTEELEILGVVCNYFIHIDHFSSFYIEGLGRRLHSVCRTFTVDWRQERRMLKMVRELLFGGEQEFSSSLDNMEFLVQKIALGRIADAQKFEEFLVNNPVGGIVMNLATVGPHWSFKDTSFENINLPAELAGMVKVAREFFEKTPSQGERRKFVQMIHPLSSCTMEYTSGSGKFELGMSTAQASLLMLFNTADSWTFSEMLTQLRITDEELVSLIHSLSQENSKFLIKVPNTETILPTDCFELNKDFTYTSPIPVPVLEDNKGKSVEKTVDKDMRCTIYCMLKRVMKESSEFGPMDREKLVGVTIDQCAGLERCGFVPTRAVVDDCIADLMKQDLILADENDPNKLWWELPNAASEN